MSTSTDVGVFPTMHNGKVDGVVALDNEIIKVPSMGADAIETLLGIRGSAIGSNSPYPIYTIPLLMEDVLRRHDEIGTCARIRVPASLDPDKGKLGLIGVGDPTDIGFHRMIESTIDEPDLYLDAAVMSVRCRSGKSSAPADDDYYQGCITLMAHCDVRAFREQSIGGWYCGDDEICLGIRRLLPTDEPVRKYIWFSVSRLAFSDKVKRIGSYIGYDSYRFAPDEEVGAKMAGRVSLTEAIIYFLRSAYEKPLIIR